jgi:RNA polymerase sigma-70 factor, ECF subfamily
LAASYSTLSSEELLKACVGTNNEAAWLEFVRRFQPVIAKVVLRTARHWAEPHPDLRDDLIQATYLKLCADNCRLLRRFQSQHRDAIFGFLKVVAASVVHDHFKSERARKRDTNQTEGLSAQAWFDPPEAGSGSLKTMETQVVMRQIDEALGKLFQGENLERNRLIFWLHHRYGMTAAAIASIPSIGLNIKGVESTLRRMTHVIQSHIGTGHEGFGSIASF